MQNLISLAQIHGSSSSSKSSNISCSYKYHQFVQFQDVIDVTATVMVRSNWGNAIQRRACVGVVTTRWESDASVVHQIITTVIRGTGASATTAVNPGVFWRTPSAGESVRNKRIWHRDMVHLLLESVSGS